MLRGRSGFAGNPDALVGARCPANRGSPYGSDEGYPLLPLRRGRAHGFLSPEGMEAGKEAVGSFGRKFLAEKEKSLNNFGRF